MYSSKKIIYNTSAQYARTILNMVLTLFSTRFILQALGVDGYGIFSLVSGVVSILSFITSALSISTQRFLSFSQGKGDIQNLKVIFNNSILLHVFIGIFLVFVVECFYSILFDSFLNISVDRIESAKIIFHSTLLVLFITFISSPFRAVIIAHENIVFISCIEVIDAILKLLIAFFLLYIDADKLVIYGYMLILIQVFNFASLSIYSYIRFDECISPNLSMFNVQYILKLFSFAGWTMYNIACVYLRMQGIAFLLNRTFGTAINAAYGIGFQVSAAFNSLSQSLMNAINPQLMRAEGSGDRKRMLRFAEFECKFTFFLLSSAAIPALFEMERLLNLWLSDVPEYAPMFCRMVVLASLVDILTSGLGSANQAVGNIRNYTIFIYTLKMMAFPCAFIILYFDLSLTYIAISYVFIEFITAILRIPFLRRTASLDVFSFVNRVFIKEIIPIIILVSCCLIIFVVVKSSFRFLLNFTISPLCYFLSIYFWGLCTDEKKMVNVFLSKVSARVFSKF